MLLGDRQDRLPRLRYSRGFAAFPPEEKRRGKVDGGRGKANGGRGKAENRREEK
jgi:hypothetical protein